MVLINEKYHKIIIIVLIPLFLIILFILFILFYVFWSSEIFGGVAGFLNNILKNNKKGMFPWISEIPLIFFFSSFTFFCLSLFFYQKIDIKILKKGLKVNLIIFSFLVLYSLFVVVKFYLL
jgi:hypothetical protein